MEQISDLFQQMILVSQGMDEFQLNAQYRLLRNYRKPIIDLLNNESFFEINSKNNMRQWQKIIQHFTLDQGNLDDLFKNLFE